MFPCFYKTLGRRRQNNAFGGGYSGVLSQGSNNTSSQSLPQLHTASQDESTAGQIQHDQMIAQQRELHSYEMELSNNVPFLRICHKIMMQHRNLVIFLCSRSNPTVIFRKGKQIKSLSSILEKNPGMLISGKNPVSTQEQDIKPKPENESQYVKLQKMSSQQAMVTEQPSTPMNRSKQVPFGLLLPVLLPQLDKDRAMQLTTLFTKLKNNEISKDASVRHIRSVVGTRCSRWAVSTITSKI
ncbi:hypothetical protein M0R45_025582 [Rubus argutus]|uniref:RST domain-containing protein n=1 Tax=Rubus argutus TaxID=59490 RepID=A0AAW1WWV4_RUBAR